ncbi:chromate transporter [Clostridium tetanomorphum]|uniref:Chromate transporter n=1 Tax=Clostridium tetanomorphum TaxID=1553 RepID=A0A923EAB2_CLOTT|nr:chromate transporter [Clostridium tetanomorphum]KAJ51128.1 chromate transport protein [Clostridium tetanomorphum DSM 665]MBC2398046.1 chromate transporter [Clostridium tetanomorphum]MBP1864444.1 chromate transporter [Clostridium tetanomorphum]NRS83025.1 chromate transporter [Clostridium tetanomorphum]NRZ98879.1 chromate transporter [Clostridium tetanomorphum]
MKVLMTMFWSFFKIGAFTFGGGYAMIPLIQAEVVDNKKWISKDEFLDILVISQSFPGALAVNTSTFIGYKIRGIIGAIMALLGTVLPSLGIIIFIASFFMQFRNNYYVDLSFKGISAAVPMLVLIAVVSLSKSVKRDYINLSIIIATILLIRVFKVHPVIVIIISGFYGYLHYRKKVE